MKQLKRHRHKNQEGFTLIELMVSLSLFVIVVLAAVASLYTVNNASKKVQAMRTALDNLNFAIESMTRSVRTGTDIGCNGSPHVDCSITSGNTGGSIIVHNTLGFDGNVEFIRADGFWSNGSGAIVKKYPNGNRVALTSPEINVTNLVFYVDGSCDSLGTTGCTADTEQPRVVIFMKGNATAGGTLAPFAVQALVSQRTFE